ncbi:hypothetical protein BDZ94DRAFT_787321 [Collybia nuda]|uniref:Annexin n=1 Tax=Collybia nuda TaxID=64659 RepID=A0A9P6CIG2_9AGAR|nr:hypothetical protein BDZ94DRAFT_787321 [Collybia nuda]
MSNAGQQTQDPAGSTHTPNPAGTAHIHGSQTAPYPPGYGPPPPLPGNRPTDQPQYAPPPGPPPGHAQAQAQPGQGYAPPPGPPPTQIYAPPSVPPPQFQGQVQAQGQGQGQGQDQGYAPPPGPPQSYATRDAPPAPQGYPTTAGGGGAAPQFPQPPPAFPAAPQGYGTHPPPQALYGGGGQYPPTTGPPPVPAQKLPLVYLGATIPDPNAPPTPHGVTKVPGYNPAKDAEAIKKAVKGFGTDDVALISTLVKIPVLQMDALAEYYVAKTGKRLIDVLDSETSSYFGMGIHALATGPLAWDAELVKKALAGAGTNEALITELVLGRPSAEVRMLVGAYRWRYGRDLAEGIRGDLSGAVGRLFLMALSANPPPDTAPVDQALVNVDVEELYKAGQGKAGTDEIKFCEILIGRSRTHLSAVIGAYGNKYRSLTKVIKAEFSGHLRTSLLHIVEGAKPKRVSQGYGVWRDAKLIDKAMVGLGTRDTELVWRVVRGHWDPTRMEAIKAAYQQRTRKTLEARVASETSGSYKKLMVAIVSGAGLGAVMSKK